MYARLRPMRSPTFELMRMKAAETRASRAMADCTPLAVVSRSSITAEMDTFMSDVSTTSTNMAIANRIWRRRPPSGVPSSGAEAAGFGWVFMRNPESPTDSAGVGKGRGRRTGGMRCPATPPRLTMRPCQEPRLGSSSDRQR